MRSFYYVLAIALSSLLLSGCYWYEMISFRIDLTTKTGTMEFLNVCSVPDSHGRSAEGATGEPQKSRSRRWTKRDIKRDWEEFINYYQKDSIMDKSLNVTSKQLMENNKALNAIFKFSFDDVAQFDIKRSADNTQYLIQKKQDDVVVETNGTTVVIDSVQYLAWDITAKEIYVKYKVMDENNKAHSLLPYYKKWKKKQGK